MGQGAVSPARRPSSPRPAGAGFVSHRSPTARSRRPSALRRPDGRYRSKSRPPVSLAQPRRSTPLQCDLKKSLQNNLSGQKIKHIFFLDFPIIELFKKRTFSSMEAIAVPMALTKRHIVKFSRHFFDKHSRRQMFCGAT
jgi:hypothetical protein